MLKKFGNMLIFIILHSVIYVIETLLIQSLTYIVFISYVIIFQRKIFILKWHTNLNFIWSSESTCSVYLINFMVES